MSGWRVARHVPLLSAVGYTAARVWSNAQRERSVERIAVSPIKVPAMPDDRRKNPDPDLFTFGWVDITSSIEGPCAFDRVAPVPGCALNPTRRLDVIQVGSGPPDASGHFPDVGPDVPGQPRHVTVEGGHEAYLVRIGGELDAVSRDSVTQACIGGRADVVIVDVSALTFLDSGGHSGFAAARSILAKQGRTLELVGAVGEPRRLLDLLDLIDQTETA